jgi:hypothetical protein
VLKTGGIYKKFHVDRLRNQLKQFTNEPLICLTDDPSITDPVVPLKNNWPGWWSKLELFINDYGKCCYFDLDVTIKKIDWVDQLAIDTNSFHVMRDAYYAGCINSSVMLWQGTKQDIATDFNVDVLKNMDEKIRRAGDQWWIQQHLKSWSLIIPPTVVSYKKHGDIPEAGVVVYHGSPKPWSPSLTRPLSAAPV